MHLESFSLLVMLIPFGREQSYVLLSIISKRNLFFFCHFVIVEYEEIEMIDYGMTGVSIAARTLAKVSYINAPVYCSLKNW